MIRVSVFQPHILVFPFDASKLFLHQVHLLLCLLTVTLGFLSGLLQNLQVIFQFLPGLFLIVLPEGVI